MALSVVKPSDVQHDVSEPLVVSRSMETNGSIFSDAIVQKNCCLHVRGSVSGNLTVESGADVVVDGSVSGKIINRGGRLLVNHKALTACIAREGPPESEAGAVLAVNLTAVAFNWERLAESTYAECAAVLECNAYGSGIEWVADALAKSGCRTFFVTNLADARRLRAVAPNAIIYVLHGLHADSAPIFANLNAQPVINNAIQLAEWNAFVCASSWSGGCALNVDTGANGLGLSLDEAFELPARVSIVKHGITLLMSSLAGAQTADAPRSDRQIAQFSELRRLYDGIPASLADARAALLDRNSHFNLVRAGAALFGINPVPGSANPMLPVVELRARIVHIRKTTKRHRLAFVSLGRADGFPCSWHSKSELYAIVDGYRCRIIAPSSLDMLAIDLTDLPDGWAPDSGEMATLIGPTMTVDEVAEATGLAGHELLAAFGSRLHRIYHAT